MKGASFLVSFFLCASIGFGCSSTEDRQNPPAHTSQETSPRQARPIPNDGFYSLVPESEKFMRNPDFPNGYSNPLEHIPIPQHPFMAPNGSSTMHNDAYMTDAYAQPGPLGYDPQVASTYYGIGDCLTVAFDKQNRIVSVCVGLEAPRLVLLEPDTLDEIASYTLPPKPWYWALDKNINVLQDTSGGAYFYLDHRDDAIVTTHDRRLLAVRAPADGESAFQIVGEYDLSAHVVARPWPEGDRIGPALPDWGGRYYWYTTRYGMVGTVDQSTGDVRSMELAGEQIQNSPAVGEDGFYVVTDHALYRFSADAEGNPRIDWRSVYERGSRKKPGMFTQGSGTTPTLIGDLVAIADNADPRMHVCLFRRADGLEVCPPVPVFEQGESATENSLIAFARPAIDTTVYSFIVENNYGYEDFLATTGGRSTVGGVSRIDAVIDGTGACVDSRVVWTSDAISPTTVPKLSLGNGLIYLYTKDPTEMIDMWYFTAIDFETGRLVYKVLTGTGLGYNNHYAPVTIDPDGRAYVGSLAGLISIRDAIHPRDGRPPDPRQ
jgi:hypothetical protein